MPRALLHPLFFLLTITAAPAQDDLADSLKHALATTPDNDTARVRLLVKAAGALREKDNNEALAYATQAVKLAESLDDKRGLAFALEHFAWILYRKGDYSQSLEISTRALGLSRLLGEKALEARCLINVAAIAYEQKQYGAAIEHFHLAFQMASMVDDRTIMARCYNNIAYAYVGMNETDSAYAYARKALSASDVAGENYLLGFALRTLGDIELLRNNPNEALFHFKGCLDVSNNEKNNFLKASVLHRLGKTYLEIGDTRQAISYIRQNIAIAEAYGFEDELERAFKMAAEAHYAQNELRDAFDFQSRYIHLHDSLYNQRSSEQIAMMQTRFDTEMKQAQIELLTQEAERQRGWLYFYATALLFFVVLATILFLYNRNSRRANFLLQEKNREIERKTRQLMNVNSTKDKLFSIISHDLRSPVANLRALMELMSKSGLTPAEFMNLTGALKKNLDFVYDDLDNLLLWAQTQLNGFQATPQEVNVYLLAEEKIALFREASARKNISIENRIERDAIVVADRNHVGIVLRNLLANAVKFNRPGGNILLQSQRRAGQYEFSVKDSGVGITQGDLQRLFNAETHFTTPGTDKEKGAGIGLLLTKEFVETNQGAIWVDSVVDRGTTFTFTLQAANNSIFV